MNAEQALVGQALDALDDVFYVYDAEGRLVRWNRRLNELFGLTDAELDGMRPEEFFVPADRGSVLAAVEQVLTEGETVVEARAETTEGLVRFELTGRRLHDEQGAPIGIAGVGRDVTEQREREWQLARQNERLDEFAGILSHDLRNPLAIAQGFLELAREERDWGALDRVDAALDRIEAIVGDTLTAARYGQVVTEPSTVDLPEVARAAWATIESEGATLSVRTTTAVEGDAVSLQRLFENLFRNAVEHGTAGDDPGVAVSVVDTEEGFAVDDDGPGVPPAVRDRVLEPGVSGSTDGTGLGLHIVESIAEAHGWTVSVGESEAGGARFAFDVRPAVEVDGE